MILGSQIRDRVIRLRYDYEGGAPWTPIEVQTPHIGKEYAGCSAVLICYTLSANDSLHSTILVGKKCKGGIWSHEFNVQNETKDVLVGEWSVRHIKANEISKKVQEKRKALEKLIGCENLQNDFEEQKKSLLHLKDVDYYHGDIHAFKLCFELFIKKPDGMIILWDRTMSNLCREEKPAKAKKRFGVLAVSAIPDKQLIIDLDEHIPHLVTDPSTKSLSNSNADHVNNITNRSSPIYNENLLNHTKWHCCCQMFHRHIKDIASQSKQMKFCTGTRDS